jgi:hypothetical protein
MQHQITDLEQVKKFIFAGNATFTLRSDKTGKHYTYRVTGAKKIRENPIFFASILTDGEVYRYIGVVPSDTKRLRWSAKSAVPQGSASFRALEWFLEKLRSGRPVKSCQFFHMNHCGRCGRELTHPESVVSGFGPECIHKI